MSQGCALHSLCPEAVASVSVNTGPYEPCFVPLRQQVVAPPEAWEDAPPDEPRFRVVLIPHSDQEQMREATVPKRSVGSLLEDFTRLGPYTVIVERA